MQFPAENILWLFKNISQRVDQNDIKLVLHEKSFFGVYIPLKVHWCGFENIPISSTLFQNNTLTFSHISRPHFSKIRRCCNLEFSAYYFHVKAKILFDFQICFSASLSRSVLNCMLTCQRILCAYLLTCQCILNAYLLTCQCAWHAYVPTCFECSRVNVLMCLCTQVPMRLSCLRNYMPTFLACLSAHVPTCFSCLREFSCTVWHISN